MPAIRMFLKTVVANGHDISRHTTVLLGGAAHENNKSLCELASFLHSRVLNLEASVIETVTTCFTAWHDYDDFYGHMAKEYAGTRGLAGYVDGSRLKARKETVGKALEQPTKFIVLSVGLWFGLSIAGCCLFSFTHAFSE